MKIRYRVINASGLVRRIKGIDISIAKARPQKETMLARVKLESNDVTPEPTSSTRLRKIKTLTKMIKANVAKIPSKIVNEISKEILYKNKNIGKVRAINDEKTLKKTAKAKSTVLSVAT